MIWAYVAGAAALGFALGWSTRHLLAKRRPATGTEPTVAIAGVAGAHLASPSAGSGAGRRTGGPDRRTSEGASTARRIVLHLGRLGRLGDDEVGRRGNTQAGMVEALDLRQGTLAKSLKRLEAAGIVRHDRRHVSGAPTRLQVYRLTPQGEALARDLRRREPRSIREESS